MVIVHQVLVLCTGIAHCRTDSGKEEFHAFLTDFSIHIAYTESQHDSIAAGDCTSMLMSMEFEHNVNEDRYWEMFSAGSRERDAGIQKEANKPLILLL